LAAILSFPSDDKGWQICFVDVLDSVALYEFSPKDKSSEWYGSAVPDIGFVQLAVCEVPSLELALEKFYLTIGMDVATIGYPMGTRSMTALGKLNQTSPFIRRGIVSSLFPYPTSKPHGFTMDIMQQGGSSGSPILRVSDGVVVGMMSSSVVEWTAAESESVSLAYSLNTNISIAEPAHILHQALAILRKSGRFKVGKLPTFSELKEECSKSDGNYELTWDIFRSK
jgi:Trypsin-like peptidase domain